MPSGHGRYSTRRLSRKSKQHGQQERLKARIEDGPRNGWGRERGYPMPGSRKKP